MTPDLQSKKRAVAYSFLAHAHNSGIFAGGPLDIFIPIVKHALSELYPDGNVKGANISELAKDLYERFNLDFPTPVLRLIMTKIAKVENSKSGMEDIVLFNDGAFIIKQFSFESYKEHIQKSKQEVLNVVNLFKKFCSIYDISGNTSEGDLLQFIEQNKTDVSYYLSHDIKDSDKQTVLAAQFVDYFKQVPTVYETLRNLYLGSLLTSYLTYQPKEVKLGVELVLDTNFIVSLLDLNTIESTKTCNTLVNICKKLGYKFTVLKDTIEEFQALMNYKAQNLGSAIIARTINKEDIYNACDRRKLTKVDLERIADNIEDTLSTDFGFYVVPHTEKWQKAAKYSHEYTVLKRIRSTEKSALHDATAILYIREKRENKKFKRFEDIRCWFVNNAISHGDLDANVESFLGDTTAQPEIIKADDLLNIIWLTSPSLDWDKDVIDLGLASMVSYTINSSLPKARIIKELDENIQKYSSANDITDKDVLRLATRIVHRQIDDVQALNEIAKRNETEFAKRVKEESEKQKEIDAENAKKLQALMDSVSGLIDNLKQNKENQEEKYRIQLTQLNEKGDALQLKEAEIERREKTLNDKTNTLATKNKEQEQKLQQLWTIENNNRRDRRDKYIMSIINDEKRKAKNSFIISIVVLVIFLGCLLVAVFLIPSSDYRLPNTCSIKIISIIISSLLSLVMSLWTIFVARHYYNWYKNPSFEKNKRDLITIPEEFYEISYNDFISSI